MIGFNDEKVDIFVVASRNPIRGSKSLAQNYKCPETNSNKERI